jgi:excisionase family DNA binding protein
MDTRPLATPAEVSEYLGVPVLTLQAWAYHNKGPRYSKIGRHRRYRWSDVEAYIEAKAKAVSPT